MCLLIIIYKQSALFLFSFFSIIFIQFLFVQKQRNVDKIFFSFLFLWKYKLQSTIKKMGLKFEVLKCIQFYLFNFFFVTNIFAHLNYLGDYSQFKRSNLIQTCQVFMSFLHFRKCTNSLRLFIVLKTTCRSEKYLIFEFFPKVQ